MKPKVYVETTIVSYLTAWRSFQLVMAANQESTRQWWDNDRKYFELFISEIVIQEATAGDIEAANRRLEAIKDLQELPVTDDAHRLAKELIDKAHLPVKAQVDALHIAVATVNGMDYLLTWNCKHIANAMLQTKMRMICESLGYEMPVISTPIELNAEYEHD
ncbi:MAG: type II toxin-antitoxin system VapC family toxin [Planctomycetota bacterium]